MTCRRRKRRNQSATYHSLERRNLLANYWVNTLEDVASPEPDGLLSLREALIAANTDAAYGDAPAGSGMDFIRFSNSDTVQMLELELGELTISAPVRIEGDVVIDAGRNSRHFRVKLDDTGSFTDVQLASLSLINGSHQIGGSIFIDNASRVTIEDGRMSFNSARSGGAIFQRNGILAISDTSFSHNSASGDGTNNGGAIHSASGTLSLYETEFSGNSASDYGGSVSKPSGGMYVSESQIVNSSSAIGGAIFLGKHTNAEVLYAKFADNRASLLGGGIASVGGELEVTASEFDGNSAGTANDTYDSRGGAIYATAELTLTSFETNRPANRELDPLTFTGNSADFGGAVFARNRIIFDSPGDERFTFTNNSAREGGAIYSPFGFELEIVKADFKFNTADHSGGAVKLRRSHTVIENVTFESNSARFAGGAISAVESNLRVRTPHFVGNEAGRPYSEQEEVVVGRGGAIAGLNSPIFLDTNLAREGLFYKNRAVGFGGAISIEGGSLKSFGNQNRFVENELQRTVPYFDSGPSVLDAAYGGAIYSKDAHVELRNTAFRANELERAAEENFGGAIYADQTRMFLFRVEFEENEADQGGAIFLSNSPDVRINTGVFRANSATENGGAISIDPDSNLNLANATIGGVFWRGVHGETFGNVAINGKGGGIYNEGSVAATLTHFHGNIAIGEDGQGGAVFNAGKFNVHHSRFDTNRSIDGGAVYSSGKLNLRNSVLDGNDVHRRGTTNVVAEGGAVYTSGDTTMSTLTFTGNKASAGGAIAISGGKLHGKSLTFGGAVEADGNRAERFDGHPQTGIGGAIAVSGDAALTLNRAVFENNFAGRLGGAIGVETGGSATVSISSRSSFLHNVVGEVPLDAAPNNLRGGAIGLESGSLVVRDTVFESNEAGTDGGAIFVGLETELELRRSRLLGNTAVRNGGAILNLANVLIADSYVAGNVAVSGGGLRNVSNGVAQIFRSEFIDNSP